MPTPRVGAINDNKRAAARDQRCGAGVALTALAETYPRSTFHGYELSGLAGTKQS